MNHCSVYCWFATKELLVYGNKNDNLREINCKTIAVSATSFSSCGLDDRTSVHFSRHRGRWIQFSAVKNHFPIFTDTSMLICFRVDAPQFANFRKKVSIRFVRLCCRGSRGSRFELVTATRFLFPPHQVPRSNDR